MGRARLFAGMVVLVTVLLSLISLGFVLGDAGAEVDSSERERKSEKIVPLIKEIERLKSHVRSLEESLKEKVASLEKKDVHIGLIKKELMPLKEQKGASKKNAEALSRLQTQLDTMVAKVGSLTKELQEAHQYSESLKIRSEQSKEKVLGLEAKSETSLKSVLEWKKRAKEAEKALQFAEATVSEAKKKLHVHGEELSRVHDQWLPPWAATQFGFIEARAKHNWSSHAKPHVDALYKHASEKAAASHALVKLHVDTVANKLAPEAQKHWKSLSETVAPHLHLLRSKTLEGYNVARNNYFGKAHNFVQPHLNTVAEWSSPYLSVIQMHSKPYMDQLSALSKPFLDSARSLLNPYLEKVSPYYRDAVSAAVKHHANLQETVRKNLSKHEVAASLISQELVWLLASALLAVPVFTALLIFSSAFGGPKKIQPTRRSPTHGSTVPGHKHRRTKKVDK